MSANAPASRRSLKVHSSLADNRDRAAHEAALVVLGDVALAHGTALTTNAPRQARLVRICSVRMIGPGPYNSAKCSVQLPRARAEQNCGESRRPTIPSGGVRAPARADRRATRASRWPPFSARGRGHLAGHLARGGAPFDR